MSKEMKAVIVSGIFILIAAIIGIFQYTLNSQSTPPANPPISENNVGQPSDLPTACIVPNVAGINESAAEASITELGLRSVRGNEYDDAVAVGSIISQKPLAGTKLEPCEGDVVIIVSLGPLPESPTNTPAQPLGSEVESSSGDYSGVHPCDWASNWELQPDGSYFWVGLPPAECDVGQADELLQRLIDGENLTLVVEIDDTPLGLDICSGHFEATTVVSGQNCVPNNRDLWHKVTGTLRVTGSTGFRVGAIK